ncbi:hypothetical protein [Swingsia samuiensis]|uniref:Lipoprotein n=1 Tax=Swingsia samuiensis TaxID=1293412 RepID=A0A4Y6UK52_9PROT|nr:hypothetical protein [Swingsia samuiensis]QDH16771.1 hypothetical protein E3D00_03710 [Swingsia samuiensis]
MKSFKYSLALASTILVAACSSGHKAEENFSPPDYSYLSPIHLNVANINIQDNTSVDSDNLAPQAPTPPNQALQQMAQQRLIANGTSGSADFIIKKTQYTAIDRHTLSGTMDVQLELTAENNQKKSYIVAHVSHRQETGDYTASSRKALYDMTNQLMQDMNVELEFQINHKLVSWLNDAAGNPLTGSKIQQQNLDSPNGKIAPANTVSTPVLAAPSAPPPPVTAPANNTPDAIFPTGG